MSKSLFINAETREITEVNLKDVLRETYSLIANDCSIVQTGAYLSGNDTMMVDEEGYFKENLEGFFMENKGFFYGNAVIWGSNDEGESEDCKTTIEDVKPIITWVDRAKCADMREQVLNRPMFTFVSFSEFRNGL